MRKLSKEDEKEKQHITCSDPDTTRKVPCPRLTHQPLPPRWHATTTPGYYEYINGGALKITDAMNDEALTEALLCARDSVALLEWEQWERAVRAQEVAP